MMYNGSVWGLYRSPIVFYQKYLSSGVWFALQWKDVMHVTTFIILQYI
uniref:Uncharacterized protein n=1 Tax=Manihot esculenta TaxID=3983 RepID=A0A2C9VH91_MANES